MINRSSFRAQAAQGGEDFLRRRRIHDRFCVPNAMALCERRNIIGLWKPAGPPREIIDIGLGGLSFIGHLPRLAPGGNLRLTIQVPRKHPLRVRGKVTEIGVRPGEKREAVGIAFTDYDAGTWSALCALHEQWSDTAKLPKAKGTRTESPKDAGLKRIINACATAG